MHNKFSIFSFPCFKYNTRSRWTVFIYYILPRFFKRFDVHSMNRAKFVVKLTQNLTMKNESYNNIHFREPILIILDEF